MTELRAEGPVMTVFLSLSNDLHHPRRSALTDGRGGGGGGGEEEELKEQGEKGLTNGPKLPLSSFLIVCGAI